MTAFDHPSDKLDNSNSPNNDNPNNNNLNNDSQNIATKLLSSDDNAGHADHWAIFGVDGSRLQQALKTSLDNATVPIGLDRCKSCDDFLVVGTNDTCHIKQVFALKDGKPNRLTTLFPAIKSPYGLVCTIDEVICCEQSQDAVLRLSARDGTTIYAFDQLYAINAPHYQKNKPYYVNFGAWAYNIRPSKQDEVVEVSDPNAIRYHRAFNDIVAKNGGQVPDDIKEQIKTWQSNSKEPLAPVQINLGHSCIYLFGETLGQEDEAWCQGQVLGKSTTEFLDQSIVLFDVVILREDDDVPFVVRIASLASPSVNDIQVHDYIQANIWLQAAIYGETQRPSDKTA